MSCDTPTKEGANVWLGPPVVRAERAQLPVLLCNVSIGGTPSWGLAVALALEVSPT